jgi:Tol biopolymer transport system component
MTRPRKKLITTTKSAVLATLFALLAAPALAQPRITGRISVGEGGAQLDGHSSVPAISADGRYVTFNSEATSLAGCSGRPRGNGDGTGALAQLYVRDRRAGATECVSKAADGSSGNDWSDLSAISGDGTIVVFRSRATNLVSPATSSRWHVFVRNRSAGTTQLVTVASDGVSEADDDSFRPRLSDNGRFVVFASRATNLVAGGTTPNRTHVYRRDLVAGTTSLVSVADDGGEPDGSSDAPSITTDARLVAFHSRATNLLATADANGTASDVFVRDITAAATELVSISTSGTQSSSSTSSPAISADGRMVAFSGQFPSSFAFVYIRDRWTKTTKPMPISGGGIAPQTAVPFWISDNGRFVALRALELITVTGPVSHYFHDRAFQVTWRIAAASRNSLVDPPLPYDGGLALRRDGREAVFAGYRAELPEDTNGLMDVYRVVLPHPRTGPGVYRPSTGRWQIERPDGTPQILDWGSPALRDLPVFADYDGDGGNDVAVYRDTTGEWVVAFSSGGLSVEAWGAPSLGDRPVPADYDGDGQADKAVYRQSTGEWLVALSTGGARVDAWGAPATNDLPVPADYDGDGKADRAVYRQSTGEWFIAQSSGGIDYVAWGAPSYGDVAVPGDYDGDGRVDVAVYRASTGEWFIRSSGSAPIHATFGSAAQNDVPVPADYDGDGITDLAIRRPGTNEWFIFQSGLQTLRQLTLGAAGDTPITLPFALR